MVAWISHPIIFAFLAMSLLFINLYSFFYPFFNNYNI